MLLIHYRSRRKWKRIFEIRKKQIKKNEKVKNKKVLYDLGVDQRDYKWKGEKTLKKVDLAEMPDYLSFNYEKYSDWLDV